MGKLIIVILWAFGSLSLVAQNDVFERVQSRSTGEGQVSIRQSPGVERMMKDYLQSNRSATGFVPRRECFCRVQRAFYAGACGEFQAQARGFAPVAEVEKQFSVLLHCTGRIHTT